MPKIVTPLTDTKVRNSEPGSDLNDGNGLLLRTHDGGSKAGHKRSWVYRFSLGGKRPETKLGEYPSMTLTDARAKRDEGNGFVAQGLDPRVQWKKAVATENEEIKPVTFGDFVEEHLPRIVSGFKNPKHRQQWENTMLAYVKPHPIWTRPIADVTYQDVNQCIAKDWRAKNVTMKRVRMRIERFMGIALSLGEFQGVNPALWEVQKHLVDEPAPHEREVRHHPAMEYENAPAFWKALSDRPFGPANSCLKLAMLTAVRSSEASNAKWEEIDLERRLWLVPGPRMKAGFEHPVPLSTAAIELLMSQPGDRTGYVFRNPVKQNALSNNAMLALLKRMGADAINGKGERITTHGWRSTLKDWVSDCTDFDPALAEVQLAHKGDALHQAYRRRTAVVKRAEMMQTYADFLTGKREMKALPTNVIAM